VIRELAANVSGYPGLLLFCAVSGILVPLPEDVSLIYAGVKLQAGTFQWTPTLVVTILGVGLRDVFAYLIGRSLGSWLLERGWVRRLAGGSRIDRAQALIARRGPSAVLIGRFFVGFRASVFIAAGAMGVPFRSFLLWDGLGLLVAVPATVGLGYVFGAPIADLVFWLLQRAQLAVGIGVVLAVAWLLWQAWSGRDEAVEGE
jgi:membrane protein DedA with SNARE-associated domain